VRTAAARATARGFMARLRLAVPLSLFVAALLMHVGTWVLNRSWSPPRPRMRFSGHWMFALQTVSSEEDEINVRTRFENSQVDAPDGVLPLHVQTSQPLHVVARSPAFVRLKRTPGLPRQPIGSVYVDRPPIGSLVEVDTNCLTTREPLLRTLNLTAWSIEAVVLFLDSPHFGRAWQTFVGRNGCQMSPGERDLQALASIYLKLTPQRTFLFEAFAGDTSAGPHQHVAVQSTHVATPNSWYHVAGVSDGKTLQLWVNGQLEASANFFGPLRVPPKEEHGDVTFGCGMFDCKITDPCSCLISEARISDSALGSRAMLWREALDPPPPPLGTEVKEDILEGAQGMPPPSPPKRPEQDAQQRGWFGSVMA